ncbi:MAG TPA: hypothetical protein DCY79_16575 [Planctomycetaceae bacterium]|nr:hypothetical protein [Blastopirellula sp.]HAY81420.1 hypothetical protein [Planctomycetaceae bacterium]|tara:strand:+ start:752 stop:1345 length:594 start_codon:yes stop_codon:yes gene_type:complete
MRILVLLVWLAIPVGVGLYHFGPGQAQVQLDLVAQHTRAAEDAAQNEQWAEAEQEYAAALQSLPSERIAEQRSLTLEHAKVQMHNKKLSTANQTLETLVDELVQDQQADPVVVKEAREALANSQYYMTWLMRLEGHSRDRWEPEIESARQTFALLAEQAQDAGQAEGAQKHQKDLESAIRLARMDLNDLQGLPLPSQ